MTKLLLIFIACQLNLCGYGQQTKTEEISAFFASEHTAFTINQHNHHSYIDKLNSVLKLSEKNEKKVIDTIELKIITDSLLDLTKDIISLANYRTEVNSKINLKIKVIDYIKSFNDLCDKSQSLNPNTSKQFLQILSDKTMELDKKEKICNEAILEMKAKYHIEEFD